MQDHAALPGLKHKAPEEQYAQDHDKGNDDDFDQAHYRIPHIERATMPENGRSRSLILVAPG
jgi:hypothetical protein